MKDIYDFSILRQLRKREKMSISDVSRLSGVSSAVISKLERNQTLAELETIYKLGRVFEMNASDILSLAECRSAQKTSSTRRKSNGFTFQEVKYGNARLLLGSAAAGAEVSKPEIHQDDYEICWVLEGELGFNLPNEKFTLTSGEAIQFDALLEHNYQALTDCKILIAHLRKGKRF